VNPSRTPILFDEIKFAMVFRVKIAEVPARLNQLLKLGLFRDKIRLHEKNASATAVRVARGATTRKTLALGKDIPGFLALGPQTTLPNNGLHALEPATHGVLVIW
jgi:hypothetical protein